MKDILVIHTGGTIGSFPEKDARTMSNESAVKTRRLLIENFANSNSVYSQYSEKIEAANFSWENTTLSESMTLRNLSAIINFIKEVKFCDYAGIIVLHGTDTLAYTAALLSFAFSDIKIPLFLVSGNRPPSDSLSNANVNFTAAIELIWSGIAPNVYVTYRNSDGIMHMFLGSSIMQSENYSEDFRSGCEYKVFNLSENTAVEDILEKCRRYSEKRTAFEAVNVGAIGRLSEKALVIKPHTGLNYNIYADCLKKGEYSAVVHGTYHSGTVCWPGLVLENEARRLAAENAKEAEALRCRAEEESKAPQSIRHLAELCAVNGVPLFIAPSALGENQYETMNVVNDNTDAVLLDMTLEAAYAKLIMALSCGLGEKEIYDYMNTDINNEFN